MAGSLSFALGPPYGPPPPPISCLREEPSLRSRSPGGTSTRGHKRGERQGTGRERRGERERGGASLTSSGLGSLGFPRHGPPSTSGSTPSGTGYWCKRSWGTRPGAGHWGNPRFYSAIPSWGIRKPREKTCCSVRVLYIQVVYYLNVSPYTWCQTSPNKSVGQNILWGRGGHRARLPNFLDSMVQVSLPALRCWLLALSTLALTPRATLSTVLRVDLEKNWTCLTAINPCCVCAVRKHLKAFASLYNRLQLRARARRAAFSTFKHIGADRLHQQRLQKVCEPVACRIRVHHCDENSLGGDHLTSRKVQFMSQPGADKIRKLGLKPCPRVAPGLRRQRNDVPDSLASTRSALILTGSLPPCFSRMYSQPSL